MRALYNFTNIAPTQHTQTYTQLMLNYVHTLNIDKKDMYVPFIQNNTQLYRQYYPTNEMFSDIGTGLDCTVHKHVLYNWLLL